jgi:glycosyltransferase involved in cell wall biosynthesis
MYVPEISVIIPTRNRPEQLVQCLDALAGQSLENARFEVIVVDDGSQPPIKLDQGRWEHAFTLTLIRQSTTGPSGARNSGVAVASGELVAFTDDDCLPARTWLAELAVALHEHPGAMVGGSTFNGLRDNVYSEASQLILEMVYAHFNGGASGAYFFASNNIACRRDRFVASGGFDAEFPAAAAEDREFCDRWRMQDRPLVWIESAVIEHRHPQSLRSFMRLHYRYGQGAFMYQHKRRLRASGTMADDLGFHRNLLSLAVRTLSRHRGAARARLAVNLLVWQVANAAGFLHAWAFGPRPGP